MNSIEPQERYERKKSEDEARALFWIERLLLFMILLSIHRCSPFLHYFYGITLPFLCPKISSAGPSGISRFWLFLLDRFMFLAALGDHEAIFLWRFTVVISIVVHSVYIIEYLIISNKPHQAVSTELRGIDDGTDDEGDVIKEEEKIRELLEELREDGKKMEIEMECIEHNVQSDLETHRRNLSVELLELREDLRYVGGKMRTSKEL